MAAAQDESSASLEVFFDGACPFCAREVGLLRRLDRRERIRFTDLAGERFDAAAVGIPMADLMDRIHARLPGGEIVEGVEVFRRIYGMLGYGPLVSALIGATRLPGISQTLDLGYRWFAKNRLRLGGRCTDESCAGAGLRGKEAPAG